MARAGFLQKISAGIYVYGPMLWRVLRKIETIVREEHDRAGCQEMLMPAIQPKDLWEESGRWERYVQDGILFHFKDRRGSEVCLGPTHEEVITDIVRREIKSYRQLPILLYQIQTKFRDEVRPRFGIMRGREFMMKDAYSFHADEKDTQHTYHQMAKAYTNIFERCGLRFKQVQADGVTVFLTTHYIEEAEFLADRVAFLDRGRIVALDTPEKLVARLGSWALDEIHPDRVESSYFARREEAAARAAQSDRPTSIRRVNLEDAFLRMTGRKLEE
jgi:prolyl-tRNA synthetase